MQRPGDGAVTTSGSDGNDFIQPTGQQRQTMQHRC
jgi:hypothetical protein